MACRRHSAARTGRTAQATIPSSLNSGGDPAYPSQPGKVFVPLDAVNLDAMDVHEFTGVASGGDRGFGGIDTGFEHGGTKHGDIESQPHDQVHGLVGGEKMFPEASTRPLPGLMSSPVTAAGIHLLAAPRDIDRLWQSWRQERFPKTRIRKKPAERTCQPRPAQICRSSPRTARSGIHAGTDVALLCRGGLYYSDFSPAGAAIGGRRRQDSDITRSGLGDGEIDWSSS